MRWPWRHLLAEPPEPVTAYRAALQELEMLAEDMLTLQDVAQEAECLPAVAIARMTLRRVQRLRRSLAAGQVDRPASAGESGAMVPLPIPVAA